MGGRDDGEVTKAILMKDRAKDAMQYQSYYFQSCIYGVTMGKILINQAMQITESAGCNTKKWCTLLESSKLSILWQVVGSHRVK